MSISTGEVVAFDPKDGMKSLYSPTRVAVGASGSLSLSTVEGSPLFGRRLGTVVLGSDVKIIDAANLVDPNRPTGTPVLREITKSDLPDPCGMGWSPYRMVSDPFEPVAYVLHSGMVTDCTSGFTPRLLSRIDLAGTADDLQFQYLSTLAEPLEIAVGVSRVTSAPEGLSVYAYDAATGAATRRFLLTTVAGDVRFILPWPPPGPGEIDRIPICCRRRDDQFPVQPVYPYLCPIKPDPFRCRRRVIVYRQPSVAIFDLNPQLIGPGGVLEPNPNFKSLVTRLDLGAIYGTNQDLVEVGGLTTELPGVSSTGRAFLALPSEGAIVPIDLVTLDFVRDANGAPLVLEGGPSPTDLRITKTSSGATALAVTDTLEDSVRLIDPSTGAVLSAAFLGSIGPYAPVKVGTTAATSTLVTANAARGTVSILDATATRVISEVPVGSTTFDVALQPPPSATAFATALVGTLSGLTESMVVSEARQDQLVGEAATVMNFADALPPVSSADMGRLTALESHVRAWLTDEAAEADAVLLIERLRAMLQGEEGR